MIRGIINNPFDNGGGGGGGDVNVIDNLTSTSSTDALSARQGRVLADIIKTHGEKIAKTALNGVSVEELGHVIVDGVTIKIDPNTGVISSTATVDIADDLDTDDATKVLSARQGVALKDLIKEHSEIIAGEGENGNLGHVKVDGTTIVIDDKGIISSVGGVEVVDNLTTEDDKKALSANQGFILNKDLQDHKKELATDVKVGHVMVDNDTITVDVDGKIKAKQLEVVDSLVDGGTDKALSAEQGKELKKELDEHAKKIATETDLGHIMVDGETILVDDTGLISINLDLEGNLRKEELVFTGYDGESITIEFEPQIVAKPFVEFVYVNTTKINPNKYNRYDDDITGKTTITFKDKLYPTDLINISLLSGLANGDEGEPLKKDSYKFENLTTTNIQGITIPFQLKTVSENFIEFVYENKTKMEESEYEIVQTNVDTLEYDLIIKDTAKITPNTMINLVLVDGKSHGGNSGGGEGTVKSVELIMPDAQGNVDLPTASDTTEGLTMLTNVIVDGDKSKAVTSDAVVKYIEELEGALDKTEYELRPLIQGQVEFNMPQDYDPKRFIEFLYFNGIKLSSSKYSIEPINITDLTQGYNLTLHNPAPDHTKAVYNLVLVDGIALGEGGSIGEGTVKSVQGILPDTSGNVTLLDASLTEKGLAQLTDKVIENDVTKALTSEALESYIEDLEGTLKKRHETIMPTVAGQTEFDMPSYYDPNKYIELIFKTYTKIDEGQYSIVPKNVADLSQGYKLVLAVPIKDDEVDSAPINIVMISGFGAGGEIANIDVIDNLGSFDVESALSANMGRVLNEEVESHSKVVASDTVLGHVKVDAKTIKIDAEGVISVDVDLLGDLRKEDLLFENLPIGSNSVTFTPTEVDDKFVDLVYFNSTKLPPKDYELTQDENGVITVILTTKTFQTDEDILNVVLIAGLADGGGGVNPVLTVNGNPPNTNGDIEIETVDKYIWVDPTVPPPNDSYIWSKK